MSSKWSPQQDAALMKFLEWFRGNPRGEYFRFFGYAGSGKASPLTTILQTPTGPITMRDIRVGDRVIGQNGKPTIVRGVYPQGVKPVYQVTFRDGSVAECCGDHLWQVRRASDIRRGIAPRVMTARDILDTGVTWSSGDMQWQIPLCDPVEFDSKVLPYHPYIIGALIGDGAISNGRSILVCPDKEIVDRVKAGLPVGLEVHSDWNHPTCPRHNIVSPSGLANSLTRHIKDIGLRVTSLEKRIPTQYLYASINDRIELLRGLMDTDGCSSRNRISFSTSSPALAQDMKTLVQSLGGTVVTRRYERKRGGNAEYQLNIKLHKINPFHLSRKANKWKPSDKNPPSRYIQSIELVGEAEQQCISVDAEDGLYLTDDFIVTHNTTCALGLAEAIGGRVLFGAYTGKAALVMSKKGCAGASTIHSLLYNPKAKSQLRIMELRAQLEDAGIDPETRESIKKALAEETARQGKPSFSLNSASPIRDADLLIVDECSMISGPIGNDLMTFGTPILALGDPAQLPPVKGSCFFEQDNPDVMLTEVHRTALDSPVLQLATMVRQGQELRLGEYGSSRVVAKGALSLAQAMDHDQTIVGKNDTRRATNRRMRRSLGFTGDFPQGPRVEGGKGDRLVCLRNNKESGLLNGMLFNVLSAEDDGESINMLIEADDGSFTREVSAHREPFLGKEVPYLNRRDMDEFDFGYALTGHKSQGSEWGSVLVADESAVFRSNRYRWLYTAITRAAERVTIIKDY